MDIRRKQFKETTIIIVGGHVMKTISRVNTSIIDDPDERISKLARKIKSTLPHPPRSIRSLFHAHSVFDEITIKFNKPLQLNCILNRDPILGHYRIYVRKNPFLIKEFKISIIGHDIVTIDLIIDNPTADKSLYHLEFFEPAYLEDCIGMYMFGFPKVMETMKRYGYEVVSRENSTEDVELFENLFETIMDVSKDIYRIIGKTHIEEIALDPHLTIHKLIIDIVYKTPEVFNKQRCYKTELVRINIFKDNKVTFSTKTIYSKSSTPGSPDTLVEYSPPLSEMDLYPRIPDYLEKLVIPFIRDFIKGGAIVYATLKYLNM